MLYIFILMTLARKFTFRTYKFYLISSFHLKQYRTEMSVTKDLTFITLQEQAGSSVYRNRHVQGQ